MPRASLIPALLFALLAIVPPALGQTAGGAAEEAGPAPPIEAAAPGLDPLDEQVERWGRILTRVSEQLKDPGLSPAVLGELEATVEGVRRQLDPARRPLQVQVDRLRALLDALGPPPKEGEPPEPEGVAGPRRDLTERLAGPEGQLKKIDVLVQATSLLAEQIAEAQRRVLAAELLVRTPPLLSAQTWSTAAPEFVALSGRVLAAPMIWVETPEVAAKLGTGYFLGLVLAMILAGFLGWYLRRWLIRSFGRKPEIAAPSFRMRVLAALAETTADVAVPILVAAVGYVLLQSRGLILGTFGDLAFGLLVAVVVFSLLRGLPRAMLAPDLPPWRLLSLGDTAARLWYRRAFVLAMIVGVDQLIVLSILPLEPSLSLGFLYSFIANGAMAAVFLAAVADKRLWLTPEEEAQAATVESGAAPVPPLEESARRGKWWLFGRVLIAALALAIPIMALLGYGVLADHVARRLVASAGVLLVAVLLHGLARDLVAVLTREDEAPPKPEEEAGPIYVWTALLVDIGLFFAVVIFLVPLWGGRWDNIVERIGWTMSGIRIGERSFSLADVLTGIVVFVLLVMAARFLQRFVNRRVLKQTRMDVGVRDAINTGIGYAGIVLAALIAVDTAGIDLSGLAIIAGALSVGIGFGMQSIVNNFVSGLILLIERPIKVGDWIVAGPDQGTVKRISVRSTQIQTFSNASVIIPNSELIAGRVTNWTYRDVSGRVELPVGVAYGSDTAKVRELLLDCAKAHHGIKPWPQPYVVFMDFGDSALLFELRFFIRDINNCLSISSDLRFAIDAAFREAGITIPFPQRDVHIVSEPRPGAAAAPEPTAPSAEGKVLPIRRGRRGDDLPPEADGES